MSCVVAALLCENVANEGVDCSPNDADVVHEIEWHDEAVRAQAPLALLRWYAITLIIFLVVPLTYTDHIKHSVRRLIQMLYESKVLNLARV